MSPFHSGNPLGSAVTQPLPVRDVRRWRLLRRATVLVAVTVATASVPAFSQPLGDQLMRGLFGAVQRQINEAAQPLPSGMLPSNAQPGSQPRVLWPDKAAFLDAARKGDLSQIGRVGGSPLNEEAALVTRSVGYLLAVGYGVPPLPRDAQGCAQQFQQNVLTLLDVVTTMHVSTLGDTPPNFYREPPQGGRSPEAVVQTINASPNCDFEVLGLRKPHPYKAALIDLVGQYGEATRAFVDAERANRRAAATERAAAAERAAQAAAPSAGRVLQGLSDQGVPQPHPQPRANGAGQAPAGARPRTQEGQI